MGSESILPKNLNREKHLQIKFVGNAQAECELVLAATLRDKR
jgi:hypothetical protein